MNQRKDRGMDGWKEGFFDFVLPFTNFSIAVCQEVVLPTEKCNSSVCLV